MSSVPSGGLWTANDNFSPARMNRKTVFQGTASEINALSPTYPGMVIFCTQAVAGSPFIAGGIYVRNPANTAWFAATITTHDHSTTTAGSGGSFLDILDANADNMQWLNYTSINSNSGIQNTTNSGSILNDSVNACVRLSTGTTSSSLSDFYFNSGWPVLWPSDLPAKLLARIRLDANTQLTFRMGMFAEAANASSSTSKKFGVECCDSAGTERTFDVFSADGTTRSATATSIAATSASPRSVAVVKDNTIRCYVDGTLVLTKSTNVPITDPLVVGSSIAGNQFIRFSLRNNSTAARSLFLHGYQATCSADGLGAYP